LEKQLLAVEKAGLKIFNFYHVIAKQHTFLQIIAHQHTHPT
jgi:hypothetical protein